MKTSPWIMIEDYCATRVIEGTDPSKVANRVAFIEKSGRVRIAPHTKERDDLNWEHVVKGDREYGRNENTRRMCDEKLVAMGYELG